MALTDSFNAVYNKKEQAKIEKQKIKLHDEMLEIQLIEDLQALQLDFITENDKNMLLLPSIKNKLIDEIINTNNIKILKNSKYISKECQKTYLLKKYDTITNKSIKISKIYDKIEEEKEAGRLKETYKNTNFIEIQPKQVKQKDQFGWSELLKICGYIAIIPFFILWGLISGIMKNKK
jgi:hypothetical protein